MSDKQKLDQQFKEWIQHPMTQHLRAWLRQGLEDEKDSWAAGAYTDQSQWATAIKNAEAIGRCGLAKTILELEPSQLEVNDEE
jgi:hypothetical protein